MMRNSKEMYCAKRYIILCFGLVASLLTACASETSDVIYTDMEITAEAESEFVPESALSSQVQKDVYVQVNGEVQNPGVYQVRSDFRVFQVITLAGGFTELADSEAVNMARPVQDEMVIYVPAEGESICASVDTGGLPTESGTSGLVNLNTADKKCLMTLPGIGEAKASAIITYREEKGGFRDISQLKEISGIKDSVYEKLKDRITV